MANWYYDSGGEAAGPVSEDELATMVTAGRLTATTWVLPEGDTEWVLLRTVAPRLGITVPTRTEPVPEPARTVPEPFTNGPAVLDPAWAPPTSEADGPTEAWSAPGPAWPVPEPWAPAPAAAGAPPELAGWGRRVVAKLVDWILMTIPSMLLIGIVAGGDLLAMIDDATEQLDAGVAPDAIQVAIPSSFVYASLATQFLVAVYFVVLNGRGQTLGKRLLGIRVVGAADGAPIGAARGAVRFGIEFAGGLVPFLFLLLLLDVLWPLWDARNQALHDKMAASVVIRSR